jgi:3-phenylpropionate/trans-cinnamate dioxygenase ferredoxin reductase subunit/benzoate/toluate 1,2-dioxygenase reductase subunit
VEVAEGGRLIEATQAAGLNLLLDCSNGQCGTCTAQLTSGLVDMDEYDRVVLSDEERAAGSMLPCVCRVKGPCALEFPYDASEALSDEPAPVPGCVELLEPAGPDILRLVVRVGQALCFEPGQYVHLRPDGLDVTRSYSMANASGSLQLEFFIRLVPDGQFSDWLQRARPGDLLQVGAPRGTFFLRREQRPRLMVAGGSGLAPFLAMLRQARHDDDYTPTTLIVGARTPAHLMALPLLDTLQLEMPGLTVHRVVEEGECSGGSTGYPTDLIGRLALDPNTRVYLCGPPPMVEAGRRAAQAASLQAADVLCERFT